MSEDKYKRVWSNRVGDVWAHKPDAIADDYYGPFTEAKIVPADAIVIERGDLPEIEDVDHDENVAHIEGLTYNLDSADAHDEGLRWLAVADYLRANPPVDEAAVTSLVQTFAEAGARIEGATFEDLVRAGVRVEVTR